MDWDIKKVRHDFPNLDVTVHQKPLVYLDNAATTLKPKTVIDKMDQYYLTGTSNVHRGVHFLSEQATAEFERARGKVRHFINAAKSSEIIFTRGTTEAINLVAQCLESCYFKEGDEILISEMEHHSNIVPWQFLQESKKCVLKVIPIDDRGTIIYEEFLRLLTPKTKFISIVYISNSLGTVNPVKDMITEAQKRGIPVLVDGAQAMSHRKIDVQQLGCDFFAFSGHKLFGPTGVGVLYGKTAWLNRMPPYQGGGDMISSVTFEKTTYNVLPYKFEAGTPHIAGVLGLGAAIDYLEKLPAEKAAAYEHSLLVYATETLSTIPGLRIIGTAPEKVPIVSFILPNIHPHDLGTLVDEDGIAIRTGHHCTQPVMKHFGVPATSRASLAFYNTKEEIDALVLAINKAKQLFP